MTWLFSLGPRKPAKVENDYQSVNIIFIEWMTSYRRQPKNFAKWTNLESRDTGSSSINAFQSGTKFHIEAFIYHSNSYWTYKFS